MLLPKLKVCVITSTRADFGILKNLILKINFDKSFSLRLVVMNPSLKKYGRTEDEIIKSGLIPDKNKILPKHSDDLNTNPEMMSITISKFSSYFQKQTRYNSSLRR